MHYDGWLHARVRDALERNGVRIVEDKAAKIDTQAGRCGSPA